MGEDITIDESMRLDERTATWRLVLASLCPLIWIGFGSGHEHGSALMGMFGVLLCALLLKPQRAIETWLWVGVGLFLILPFLGLLPTWLFSAKPGWRVVLQEEWGIQMGGMWNPQPWVMFEKWLYLLAGVSWLLCWWGQVIRYEQKLWIYRWYSLGIAVLAILSIGEYYQWVKMDYWPRDDRYNIIRFGPFYMRNLSYAFFALSVIIHLEVIRQDLKTRKWMVILALIGMMCSLSCVALATSRGALLLLAFGACFWFLNLLTSERSFKKIAVLIIVLTISFFYFVVSGTEGLDRILKGHVNKEKVVQVKKSDTSQEIEVAAGRAQVYAAAIKMTEEYPWLGVGLGNFIDVFSMHFVNPSPIARYTHPESSLVWIYTEMGMFAILLIGWILVKYLKCCGLWFSFLKKKEIKNASQKLRQTSALLILMFIVNACYNVNMHQLVLMLFILVIASLGLSHRNVKLSGTAERIGVRVGVVISFGILAVHHYGLWSGEWALKGEAVVMRWKDVTDRYLVSGQLKKAASLMKAGLVLKPLDFELHYRLGVATMSKRDDGKEAILHFGRSRVIEPYLNAFRLQEAQLWSSMNQSLALLTYRDLLMSPNISAKNQARYFLYALESLQMDEQTLSELWTYARTGVQKYQFLMTQKNQEVWDEYHLKWIANENDLDELPKEFWLMYFKRWVMGSDKQRLLDKLKQLSGWLKVGWPILAKDYVENKNFESAYYLAEQYYFKNLNSGGYEDDHLGTLMQAYILRPDDPLVGLRLARAQRKNGMVDVAVQTLESVMKLKSAPKVVWVEMVRLRAERGEYRKAWDTVEESLSLFGE
jgi:hypothetical protein